MLAFAHRFVVVHLLLLLLMANIGIGTLSACKLFEQMPSFSTEMPSLSTEMRSFSTEMRSFSTEMPSFSTKMPSFSTEMPSLSTEAPAQLQQLRLETVGDSAVVVVVRHKAVLHPSTAPSRRRYNAECFFTPVNCHQFVRRTVFVTRPLLAANALTTAMPQTTTDHFWRRRKGTHRKRTTKRFRHRNV